MGGLEERAMVGLVIASHGRLAEEMLATAEQIVGKFASVATCSIEPGSSPHAIREQMHHAVDSVESGDGVIVLADLFGGTPCKESLMLCQDRSLEVLAGVNLPMLIKANSLRETAMPLGELAQALASHAQRNITCASALLRHAQERRPH